MTNLDFDALLNADSIPVLRGTKHIATQEAKMLRFDSGYQKIGMLTPKQASKIMIHPVGLP